MIKYDDSIGDYVVDQDNKDKFTAYDFESIDSINALSISQFFHGYNSNDANGFTPLCFAALNNVEPTLLIYLAHSESDIKYGNYYWAADSSDSCYKGKGSIVDKVCNKGKNPIEYAIMSANSNAIDVLFGGEVSVTACHKLDGYDFYKYADKYDTKTGQPIFVVDEDGNDTDQIEHEEMLISIDGSLPSVDKQYILDAASMPKPDLLTVLGKHYKGYWFGISSDHDAPFNDNKYTPLIAATKAQCYDSIRYILEKIPTEYRHIAIEEKSTDSYNQSSLDIAVSNNDIGAQEIFATYCSDDSLLEYLFAHDLTDSVKVVLKGKQQSAFFNIFNWKDSNNNNLLTKEYEDSSGNSVSVLSYINNHYNNSLPQDDCVLYFFNAICSRFNTSSEQEKESLLLSLVKYNCYHIISAIYNLSNINTDKFTDSGYAFDAIKSKHDEVDDSSILELYISSSCYYLIKLLLIHSMDTHATNFKLNRSEYTYLSNVDNEIINCIFVELCNES